MPSGVLYVEDEPRLEDVAALDDRLHRYNVTATGHDDGRWLAIFVRDDAGQILGGLHGWTWGGTGFVRTLWVREDLRGHRLGARLLAAAESEAVRRGCRVMQLDTHSYQAPGFYQRLGYEQLGELPGWPGGSTRLFFRKALEGDVVGGGPPLADRLEDDAPEHRDERRRAEGGGGAAPPDALAGPVGAALSFRRNGRGWPAQGADGDRARRR